MGATYLAKAIALQFGILTLVFVGVTLGLYILADVIIKYPWKHRRFERIAFLIAMEGGLVVVLYVISLLLQFIFQR